MLQHRAPSCALPAEIATDVDKGAQHTQRCRISFETVWQTLQGQRGARFVRKNASLNCRSEEVGERSAFDFQPPPETETRGVCV